MDRKITAAMDERMTGFYGVYNKLSKNDTVADRGTRQVVLNMIKEYQKNDDLGTVSGVQQLVYGTVKADGQTDLLPSTMRSTVKDGNGMEHTLSGVQYVEFQADYNRLYWAYAEQLLPRAKSDRERIVTLRNLKALALEQAKNQTLGRIGAPKGDNAKFKGISAEAIVRFKAATSKELADTDGSGSVNRQEFIAAIRVLGLGRQTSSTLYRTKYSDESDPWRQSQPNALKHLRCSAKCCMLKAEQKTDEGDNS